MRLPAFVLLPVLLLAPACSPPPADGLIDTATAASLTGEPGARLLTRYAIPEAHGDINILRADDAILCFILVGNERQFRRWTRIRERAEYRIEGIGDEAFLTREGSEPLALFVRAGEHSFAIARPCDSKTKAFATPLSEEALLALARHLATELARLPK